jgi:hypothetical protein
MANIRMMRWGLVAAVLSMGCGVPDSGFPVADEEVGSKAAALTTTAVMALVITSTQVTRDPERTEDPCSTTPGDENKVWSIGHLLKKEAEKTGNTPSNYVSSWMSSWIAGNPSLNGQTVPPLFGPMVRDNWQRFAGGSTSMPLHKAPFWLLAIVSRLDLRKHRPQGEPLGGEVRFVFGFLATQTNNPSCPTTQSDSGSTIIFEYSPNKSNENDVRDFGRRWLEVTNVSSHWEYRNKLAGLTEEVINTGKLLRIRTNEGPSTFNVGGTGAGAWDMGEFEPDPTTKLMRRSTIKQSPTEALAGGTSQPMSDWIWANRDPLLANAIDLEIAETGSNAVARPPIGSYSVPDRFPSPNNTTWFRGSRNILRGGDFWSGSPAPTGFTGAMIPDWVQARFRFSLGTCKGCHAGETGTGLLHIQPPGIPGSEAIRSPFLSGPVSVTDPEWGSGVVRTFDEMARRENDLRALVNQEPVMLPVFGNYYQVRFRATGKCLDSEGNTTADGAPSKLYTCHGNGNQRLALVPAPGQPAGVYNLKYKHSGKCIDVQNASTSPGARIEQRTCDGSRASQRLALEVRTGTVPNSRVLRFKHSARCLVPGNGTTDGTAIIQASCPATGFDLVE